MIYQSGVVCKYLTIKKSKFMLKFVLRYNLIRSCPKPSKVKLDKATNIETKTVTRRYLQVISV